MRPDSRRICHGPDSRPRAASVEPVRYMLYRHNDIIKCPVNPHSTGDVVKAGLVPATGRVSRKTEALRSAGPAQQAGPALAEAGPFGRGLSLPEAGPAEFGLPIILGLPLRFGPPGKPLIGIRKNVV